MTDETHPTAYPWTYAVPDDHAATVAAAEAPFFDAPEGWTESAVWTGSGFLDVLDPDPDQIKLYEVAVGLARQCRFGPAAAAIYTVAEHSVACCRIMRAIGAAEEWSAGKRRDLECAALMHDAPEYVLRDFAAPVKRQCPDYRRLDALLSRAVETRFRLPGGILDAPEVKRVDRLAADTEARVLLPDMPAWPGMSDGHPDGITRTNKPAAYFRRTAQILGMV